MKTRTILVMMEHNRYRHVGEKYDDILVMEPCFEFPVVRKQGVEIKQAFEKLVEKYKEEDGDDFVVDVKIDAMPQHEVMVTSTQGIINEREKREVICLPEKYDMLMRKNKRKGEEDAKKD